MKIKISREIILPALQAANNVVERRQTLPILSNLLFQVEGKQLRLTATDMEVELNCEIECTPDTDGAIALPARKLFDICRALPNDAELVVDGSGSKTKVSSGRSRFSLASMKADEFPSVGAFEADVKLELDVEVLNDLIESTHFAMAHQDVRYYLNGLLLELDNDRIRAVATDGHRLALCEKSVELAMDEARQVIVPRKGVLEIARMISNAEGSVSLTFGGNHLRVDCDHQSLTSKLVDGRFPDYERVIPRESDHAIIAEREALRAGLSRASILSNEKFRGIRLIMKKNLLTAVAHNPEQEEAEEEIEVEYDGPDLEVGFNVSYLLDVLGVMRSDQVRVDVVDANSSCLMRMPGDDSARYVVMPMRL